MSALMEQYYKFREYLGIDVLDIEGAFAKVPRILGEVGELSARADKHLALAKFNISVAEANVAATLRLTAIDGKTPSVAAIDRMLPLDPEVQQAVKDWGEALQEATAIEKLHKDLEGQWIMMHKVSDLTMSGYFNPGVLPDRPYRDDIIRRNQEIRAREDKRAEDSRRVDRTEIAMEPRRVARPIARSDRAEAVRNTFNRRHKED